MSDEKIINAQKQFRPKPERDERGRFKPKAKLSQEAYREIASEIITKEQLKKVIAATVERAAGGHFQSMKLILDFALGRTPVYMTRDDVDKAIQIAFTRVASRSDDEIPDELLRPRDISETDDEENAEEDWSEMHTEQERVTRQREAAKEDKAWEHWTGKPRPKIAPPEE